MTEVLKSLWEKLYAWALPSALALGCYWIFVHPRLAAGHDWLKDASDSQKAAIFAALTLTIAFCLNVFSTPLYRILEGYLLWPRWAQRRGVVRQQKRKHRLQQAVNGAGWHRGLALERLALYPMLDEQVVPTRLGNAIRSFETYGKTRFNLDSQTLWHELCAVAPKYTQDELNSARSSVDFFVAVIYLSFALGIVGLGQMIAQGFDLPIAVVCIVAFGFTVTGRWFVVRATGEWGYVVQALVNIGRVALADSLGLQLPENIDDEKQMWGLLTSYIFFARLDEGAQLDRFRKKNENSLKYPTLFSHSARRRAQEAQR